MTNLLMPEQLEADQSGIRISLEPYGYRWYRADGLGRFLVALVGAAGIFAGAGGAGNGRTPRS